MAHNKSKKHPLYRILIIISGMSFLGTTLFGLAGLFSSAFQKPQDTDTPTSAVAAQDSQLEVQERGYELVLKREPENQVVLEGLVQVRLQKDDLQGAVAPLEKLVELNPNRTDYKALLAQIKEQTSKKKQEK